VTRGQRLAVRSEGQASEAVSVALQPLQLLARSRRDEAESPIRVAQGQQPPVRGECHLRPGAKVPISPLSAFLTRGNLPKPERPVSRSPGQRLAVGRER